MFCYTKDDLTAVTGNVLFLGDSITDDGRYLSFLQAYLNLYNPDYDLTIYNLGVCSETISGLSEPDHPFPRPCLLNRLQNALNHTSPDWVVLCYGINDAIYYPFSQERLEAYKTGYLKAIEIIRSFSTDIHIVVLPPPPFDPISFKAAGNPLYPDNMEKYSFMAVYENYNDVIKIYADWIINELPAHVDLAIDVFSPLSTDIRLQRQENNGYISGDGIHPNQHGHWIMARALLQNLFGVHEDYLEYLLSLDNGDYLEAVHQIASLEHARLKELVGHDNPYKTELLPQNVFDEQVSLKKLQIPDASSLLSCTSTWNGFVKKIFFFDGFQVTLVSPNKPIQKDNCPWIWRTEFFGAFPSADIAFLQNGYYLVHISISDLFGCPESVFVMNRFYHYVTEALGLSKQTILLGFSRGALYAVNYTAAYPHHVKALYLDAPVVDVNSWPRKFSQCDWERVLKAFPNGVDYNTNITALLNNKIPLIMVAGDSDSLVPFEENGALILDAYKNSNLPFKCILKPGIDHHPHGLDDPSPIVDFISSI